MGAGSSGASAGIPFRARVMGAMGRDLNQATSLGAVVVVVWPLDCVALMGECIGYGKPNAPDATVSALAHDTLLSNGTLATGGRSLNRANNAARGTCQGNSPMKAFPGRRGTRRRRDASRSSTRFAAKLLCESGSSAAVMSGATASNHARQSCAQKLTGRQRFSRSDCTVEGLASRKWVLALARRRETVIVKN